RDALARLARADDRAAASTGRGPDAAPTRAIKVYVLLTDQQPVKSPAPAVNFVWHQARDRSSIVVGRASTTSSTRPNSLASSGDRNLSRSTAAEITSSG